MVDFYFVQDRARELADTIGGDALSLADLDNFHPEEGMILANTTSIGMQPKVDETPISKVWRPPILLNYKSSAGLVLKYLIIIEFAYDRYDCYVQQNVDSHMNALILFSSTNLKEIFFKCFLFVKFFIVTHLCATPSILNSTFF